MAKETTETEDREAIRDVLLQWRDAGEERPVIAVYDAESMVPVFYGLDGDQLIVLEDGSVEDSVSAPTGEGVEVGESEVLLEGGLLGETSKFVVRDGSRLTPAMLADGPAPSAAAPAPSTAAAATPVPARRRP